MLALFKLAKAARSIADYAAQNDVLVISPLTEDTRYDDDPELFISDLCTLRTRYMGLGIFAVIGTFLILLRFLYEWLVVYKVTTHGTIIVLAGLLCALFLFAAIIAMLNALARKTKLMQLDIYMCHVLVLMNSLCFPCFATIERRARISLNDSEHAKGALLALINDRISELDRELQYSIMSTTPLSSIGMYFINREIHNLLAAKAYFFPATHPQTNNL